MVKCQYCEKVYPKKGIGSHIWRAHGPGKSHNPNVGYANGSRAAWNKGLTKETNEAVRRNAEGVSKCFQKQLMDGTYIPRYMGQAARTRLSATQSTHNRGGKCKWFDVDGKKVQGTWEKYLAEQFVEHHIKWTRSKITFDYMLDGKLKKYTPDFFLPDYNVFLEVKGYWWGNDRNKMDAVIEQYPNTKFVIIEKKEYNDIEQDFSVLYTLLAKVAQSVVAAV